jgi:UDP-N-acetyl-D-mannosaminuronate dehydrogenase
MSNHLVIGLGEIGAPILEQLQLAGLDCQGHDPDKGVTAPGQTGYSYLHICIPGGLANFKDIVLQYYYQFREYAEPTLLIHSTVPVGTTTALNEYSCRVLHTPVIGKHGNGMAQDMLTHPKFIGGTDCPDVHEVFQLMGYARTIETGEPEVTELGKIMSTTLLGYLIAWEQEKDRMCKALGVNRYTLNAFFTDVSTPDYDATNKFPGVIGGHCVLPNIAMLKGQIPSAMLNWIENSNKRVEENIGKDPNSYSSEEYFPQDDEVVE